jgi:ferritin
MQLPDELYTALNAQMNREQANARFYEQAASRFETLFLSGFAALMRRQQAGEIEHAAKVRDYLIDRNLEPTNDTLSAERLGTAMVIQLFSAVLKREQDTSNQWEALYLMADVKAEVPTIDLSLWFMREQVEEERLATEWLGRVTMAGNNMAALLILDAQAKGD